jgi:hypothetical protein
VALLSLAARAERSESSRHERRPQRPTAPRTDGAHESAAAEKAFTLLLALAGTVALLIALASAEVSVFGRIAAAIAKTVT